MPNVKYTNRKFTRILFEVPAELEVNSEVWPCQVVDISLKGILVKKPENWPLIIGNKILGRVKLTDEIHIEMDLTIVHSNDSLIGMCCDYIDLDSASHLRRLVELNLGDAKMLEREIGALLKGSA